MTRCDDGGNLEERKFGDLRSHRDRLVPAVLGRLASHLLQERVPFYFAAIFHFHIGRMMVVSNLAIERMNLLRIPEHLDASTYNLIVTPDGLTGFQPENVKSIATPCM